MEEKKSAVICIVGMHRSGTSMIARLLNRCGLEMGPSDALLGPDAANPLGHFEHKGFLNLDRKLLKHFGATWFDPPQLVPCWEQDPTLAELMGEAKEVADQFPKSSIWGWKEPRASIFLPFWQAAIPGMRFVICLRNPLEVARSLEKRNGMSVRKATLLWYRYTTASLEDTAGRPRIITFFEDFFGRGSSEMERAIDFCGLPKRADDVVIQSAISGGLRHHTSGVRELLEDEGVSPECKLLYTGLRALSSRREDGSNANMEELDGVSSLYLRALKQVKAPLVETEPPARWSAKAKNSLYQRAAKKLKKIIVE